MKILLLILKYMYPMLASIKFNLPRNYASGLIGSEPDLSSRYDKHVHNFVAKENET